MRFVQRHARAGVALVDPMAEVLADIGRQAAGDARRDVAAFVTLESVFGVLADGARFVSAYELAYETLGAARCVGPRDAVEGALHAKPPIRASRG